MSVTIVLVLDGESMHQGMVMEHLDRLSQMKEKEFGQRNSGVKVNKDRIVLFFRAPLRSFAWFMQ